MQHCSSAAQTFEPQLTAFLTLSSFGSGGLPIPMTEEGKHRERLVGRYGLVKHVAVEFSHVSVG